MKKIKAKTWKIIKIICKAGLFVFAIAIISALTGFLFFIKDLPRPENFQEGIIPESTKIYATDEQTILYEVAGDEKRTNIPLSEIPLFLQQAAIATEDKNFYTHSGVDLTSIVRAVLHDLKIQRKAQGASTISQQLIRTYFLTAQKTIKRKTQEIILALELENKYPKEKILEWYLNLVPFGSNLYGVESASWAFFNKPAKDISLAQSAVLVALIKSPSALSPFGENKNLLLARKDYVLERMFQEGYLNKEQKEEAQKETLEFSKNITNIKAPHFVMYVRDYLEKKYGLEFLTRNGLKVYTTLDFELQQKAEEIVRKGVLSNQNYKAYNAALVAITPKNGQIVAMVGSKSFFESSLPAGCNPGKNCKFDPQVNVALSPRQPGSAFKPFVYAMAFYKGFTPNTKLWDVPTEFNPYCSYTASQEKDRFGQKCYNPVNYEGGYKGQMTMKNSLAQSRNVTAVKTLYLAGIKETIALAKRMGITTLQDENRYGLSLALGGGEVKLLDITHAYTVFANDGYKTPVSFIKRIEDNQGRIIESYKSSFVKILPKEVARQINDILSDNAARTPVFGANSTMYVPGYQVAVKTGTTQFLNDAWAIGYSTNLSVGVWAGNNDNSPATRPSYVLAGPIWNEFMSFALQKFANEKFIQAEPIYSSNPILSGRSLDGHSILYHINKNDPVNGSPNRQDEQFNNWERAVQNWVSWH